MAANISWCERKCVLRWEESGQSRGRISAQRREEDSHSRRARRGERTEEEHRRDASVERPRETTQNAPKCDPGHGRRRGIDTASIMGITFDVSQVTSKKTGDHLTHANGLTKVIVES